MENNMKISVFSAVIVVTFRNTATTLLNHRIFNNHCHSMAFVEDIAKASHLELVSHEIASVDKSCFEKLED